jgi:hypothetical protein
MTAGRGIYPNGTPGSATVFIQRAMSQNPPLPTKADFIECEGDNITVLEHNIETEIRKHGWNRPDTNFHQGRYETEIPKLFPGRDSLELGLFYIDHSGDAPDLDTLGYINQVRPRMDILLYLSATNIKRIYQTSGKQLSDYLIGIGKNCWLIRKAFGWDKHQWTFLLGSNCDLFKRYKRISFYPLTSPEGQEIFETLNLTEKQRIEKYQPLLFEIE